MTIDQMIAEVTKAIENGQTVKVYGTHYPVTIEIDGEVAEIVNNRSQLFYQLEGYGVDVDKIIWV